MAIIGYDGTGKPLDDKRLSLSGTTEAGEQVYRIWHDGQQILVPRGQSITKPLAPENVGVNTGVFGRIRKGYFQQPIVEFRNTNENRLFDRFMLSTYRDEFPDDPDTDLETLGAYIVDLQFTLVIDFNGYHWEIPKTIILYRVGENIYQTADSYNITTYTPYSTQGVQEYNIEMAAYFNIDIAETHALGELPFGGHILHMGLQNCRINRGSSEYLYNQIFNRNLPNITFSATEISVKRGWS